MRREDWPRRLHDFLSAADERPFSWGEWDCGQFAGAAIEAMTGANPMAQWAGQWDDAAGMLRRLKTDYDGSLPAFWTSILGPEINTPFAGRGDLVLMDDGGGDLATGIVDLTGERAACLTLDGIEYLPMSAAVAAWKVT